jgi:hypothetical protein
MTLPIIPFVQSVFVLDRNVRTVLPTPRPLEVDYRTSCFCHNKIIDRGFVCSVCLSSIQLSLLLVMYRLNLFVRINFS